MEMETLASVLGWSAIINYGVLLYWFGMFVLAHDWCIRMHGRWFSVPIETFDAIHYALTGWLQALHLRVQLGAVSRDQHRRVIPCRPPLGWTSSRPRRVAGSRGR